MLFYEVKQQFFSERRTLSIIKKCGNITILQFIPRKIIQITPHNVLKN